MGKTLVGIVGEYLGKPFHRASHHFLMSVVQFFHNRPYHQLHIGWGQYLRVLVGLEDLYQLGERDQTSVPKVGLDLLNQELDVLSFLGFDPVPRLFDTLGFRGIDGKDVAGKYRRFVWK